MAAFILLCLLIIPVPGSWAATTGDMYRYGKEATALIVGIDEEAHALSFGSGVFLSDDGLLVTNAHVIQDSPRIVVFGQGRILDMDPQVLAVDPDLDLAALRVASGTAVSFLSLSTNPAQEGTSALAIGYPRLPDVLQMGLTIHATVFPVTVSGEAIGQSRVKKQPLPYVHITGFMNAGSSGGPLVNIEQGTVEGLVVHTVPYLESAKNAQGESVGRVMLRAGLSYCIPASRIRSWLATHHLTYSDEPVTPSRRRPLSQTSGFLATAHLLQLMTDVIRKDPELLDLAVHHYESALRVESQRPDVWHHLGVALAAKGETDKAGEMYEKALALAPDDPALLTDIGALSHRTNDTDKAMVYYEKALGHDACYVRAWLGSAAVYGALGKNEEASRALGRAARCPQSSPLEAYQLGLELERRGAHKDALMVWERSLDHSPAEQESTAWSRMKQRATKLRLQEQTQQQAPDLPRPVSTSGS